MAEHRSYAVIRVVCFFRHEPWWLRAAWANKSYYSVRYAFDIVVLGGAPLPLVCILVVRHPVPLRVVMVVYFKWAW